MTEFVIIPLGQSGTRLWGQCTGSRDGYGNQGPSLTLEDGEPAQGKEGVPGEPFLFSVPLVLLHQSGHLSCREVNPHPFLVENLRELAQSIMPPC